MIPKVSRNTNRTNKRTKPLYIIIGITLAIIILPMAYFEVRTRLEYNSVDTESERVMSETSQLEQIKQSIDPKVNASGGRGNGIVETLGCWPDNDCPYAHRSQLVLIEDQSEQEILESLMLRNGYENHETTYCKIPFVGESGYCSVAANGPRFYTSATLSTADSYHHGVPEDDPSPYIWRILTINTEPRR